MGPAVKDKIVIKYKKILVSEGKKELEKPLS
jgi:hypothetical protein